MTAASGPIARAEYELMVQAFGLMLLVVVPVILMTLVFAWRYRANGGRGAYRPDWEKSTPIELVVWGVPAILILVLGTMVWESTHRLDPYKPLAGDHVTRVEAVALNWKWLFIYPDLGVATVNELAIPVGQPVSLRITSDVAMNSLMIPALVGQIYAMAGMETKLNFQADHTGQFQGRNMQFSGAGFPEQTFGVLSMTATDFETWTGKVRDSDAPLDTAEFQSLSAPSIAEPVRYYTSVPDGFFETILQRHMKMDHAHTGEVKQ
jgi:cytochrome o ubiquinol oxidase subunit 2